MAKSNKNVIVESVSKGDQDVNYQLIEVVDGQKLKFDLRSNSYKFQCYARVYVWNVAAQDWHLVHHIFPLQMQTADKLCYGQGVRTPADFAKDVTELRRVAVAILF
jgi:hypothetical protein